VRVVIESLLTDGEDKSVPALGKIGDETEDIGVIAACKSSVTCDNYVKGFFALGGG